MQPSPQPGPPPSRNRLLLDIALAVWAIAWIVLGIRVALNLRDVRQVSDTMESISDTIDSSNVAVDALGNLPLAGATFDDIAADLTRTATDVRESAAVTRSALTELSIELGVAMAVIPTASVLPLYVSARRSRR
ncbi:MAG: hypothetical protein KDB21_08890 [Acidimicrobiales bacterium]|nr:hypothetical protein [Acidimicrobiales bacterium]